MDLEQEFHFGSKNTYDLNHLEICPDILKILTESKDWLKNTESPFKWLSSLHCNRILNTNTFLRAKLLDYTNQGSDYGFEKFTIHLVILVNNILYKLTTVHPQHTEENGEESDCNVDDENVNLDQCYEQLLRVLEEMKERRRDVMYTRIGPALEHVMLATRAHMLCVMGKDEQSQEVAKCIAPADKFHSKCKAGLEAIKAKFILHIHHDKKSALEASLKSIALDPNFGYWHYSTGKIMRLIRRHQKQTMERVEFDYFKKAVALEALVQEENPKFIVYLAQAYLEMGLTKSKTVCSTQERENIAKVLRKATTLYKQCWRLNSDSAPIARRISYGMLRLKGEHGDRSLLKLAIQKATTLSPNEVIYHALGKFYLWHEHDEEKGVEYLNKSEQEICVSELIRYQLIKDPKSDVSKLVEKLMTISNGKSVNRRVRILCDAGWYYLCVENNLYKAACVFQQVFTNKRRYLREFQSYPFVVKGPLNMITILVNQISLHIAQNNKVPTNSVEIQFLTAFQNEIFKGYPNLRRMTPSHDLLPSTKRSVEMELAQLRKHCWFAKKHVKKDNKMVPMEKKNHSRKEEKMGNMRDFYLEEEDTNV